MQASFARMLKFNKEFFDSKEVYRKQQAWYLQHKPTNGLFCPSNMIFEFSPIIKQVINSLIIICNTPKVQKCHEAIKTLF